MLALRSHRRGQLGAGGANAALELIMLRASAKPHISAGEKSNDEELAPLALVLAILGKTHKQLMGAL